MIGKKLEAEIPEILEENDDLEINNTVQIYSEK
jgi:hypothetical protein